MRTIIRTLDVRAGERFGCDSIFLFVANCCEELKGCHDDCGSMLLMLILFVGDEACRLLVYPLAGYVTLWRRL